jgi:branched-chain amino acid transport system substrate-binding protein
MEDKKLKTSKLFYSVIGVVLFFIIIVAFYLFVYKKSPDNTIKIGEIQTYSQLTSFTFPYRNGWQLALEEINKAGGVMGRKIEVISRDDQGKPGEAVKIAEELVSKDKVVLLMGSFLSNVGLAVTDFAKRNKVLYIAAEPLIYCCRTAV